MEKVSVLKCKDYNPKRVRKALLESLKNIDFDFEKYRGKKVLLKPNLLSANKPEEAITTHPIILQELCKILKEYHCQIYIGDSSAMFTDSAIKKTGMARLSKYAKIINFEGQEKIFHDFGENMRRIPLPKILFEADLIINLPKMKTHGLTSVTLCVKNLYGCIPGELKGHLHKIVRSPNRFSKLLLNIENVVKPDLNIIDGITGIEGNGPGTTGQKNNPKLIIAGRNPHAVDLITSKIMGFNPQKIATVRYSRLAEKNIEVIGLKDHIFNFKKPSTSVIPFFNFMITLISSANIDFNKTKCKKCHLCEKKCPVKAITLETEDGFPKCDHKKCITCLCCMEVCPHKAVYLRDSILVRFAKKIMNIFIKS